MPGSLSQTAGCRVLDMRDVSLLRELAQEASFCSSSTAREMQASLFQSEAFMYGPLRARPANMYPRPQSHRRLASPMSLFASCAAALR